MRSSRGNKVSKCAASLWGNFQPVDNREVIYRGALESRSTPWLTTDFINIEIRLIRRELESKNQGRSECGQFKFSMRKHDIESGQGDGKTKCPRMQRI